jgi:hypothetical protein
MKVKPSNRLTPEGGARRMFLNRQQAPSEGPRVRVRAANEMIKQYIFHPAGRLRFGADGTVEWPDDQFTQRRVRDGDVTIEKVELSKSPPPKRARA